MALTVFGLKDLLKSGKSEEEINQLLFSFCSLPSENMDEPHDVEFFLHRKAIEFEKHDLARTYLVMSNFRGKPFLAGYYSISNKPLIITKKNFQKFSGSLKKRLYGIGHTTERNNYECKGYLLGQLGKNFAAEAQIANSVSGRDLMKLATDTMLISYETVGGRIFYLECEDQAKLKEFYINEGFREIEGFRSDNDLCLFVRRISS